MKGKIAEIFESFQGEGLYLGERQLFVRFFGCNLSCKFCDTKLNRFTEYTSEELDRHLSGYGNGYHSVVFTGGEPLLQKDFLRVALEFTRGKGFKNYLETNGTLAGALEEVIDMVDIVAMDLKLPSSTSMQDFWQEHQEFLKIASRKEVFLKMVVCESTKDKDLLKAIILIRDVYPAAVLVLQPDGHEDYIRLKQKIEDFREISTENGVISCIIPQVHKAVGLR